jgi:hypothetical protein
MGGWGAREIGERWTRRFPGIPAPAKSTAMGWSSGAVARAGSANCPTRNCVRMN